MKLSIFSFFTLCLTLSLLTSCQRFCCNNWSEKDCYYSDYYQSEPIAPRHCNYYHSDPVR